MVDKNKLTKKQELFCMEYLKDFNTGRAYSVAYNKKKITNAVYSAGCRLLKNVKIQAFLKEYGNKKTEEQGVTIEYIIKGIKDIADKGYAKDTDRLKALELLGRWKKMFTDKLEVEGTVANAKQDQLNDLIAKAEERLKNKEVH